MYLLCGVLIVTFGIAASQEANNTTLTNKRDGKGEKNTTHM